MSIKELVARIPKEYRDKLLDENVIYKAVVSKADRHMQILFAVWTTYVDPTGENNMDCPYCLNNILQSFKMMVPHLVEMSKDDKILDDL